MKKLLLTAAVLLSGATAFAWNVGDEITDQVTWGNLSFTEEVPESGTMNYWKLESSKGSFTKTGGLFEVYDGEDVDLYQYVPLKAGMYRVECQGYYRCGNSWADDPSVFGTSDWQDNALLYVQNGKYDISSDAFTAGRTFKTPLMPRLFEKCSEKIYTMPEGEASWDMSDGSYTVDGNTIYGPCSVPGSLAWFNAGHYKSYNDGDGTKYNTVTFFLTEDGYARIGVSKKDPRSADSFMVTNFRLYYEGEAGEAAELMALQDEVQQKYDELEALENKYTENGLIYTLISDARMEFDGEIGSISSLDKDGCKAAITTLNSILEKAKSAATATDNLKSIVKNMEILYNATDYAGKAEFGKALKAAQDCLDPNYEVTGTEDFDTIQKIYDNLCAARITYLLTQEPVNGKYDFTRSINYPFFCNNEYTPSWNAEMGYYAYVDDIETTFVANYQEKDIPSILGEHSDWPNIVSNVTWKNEDGTENEWIFNHHVTSGWMGGIDNITMQHGYTAVGAWSGSPVSGYQEVRQVVTGLPNGFYSMGALYINAGNEPDAGQYVYICPGNEPNDDTMVKGQFTHKGTHWWWGAGNYPLYRTDDWQNIQTNMVYVDGGKVTIGSRSTWFYAVTGFQLYYYGETPDFYSLLSESIASAKAGIETLSFKGDQNYANMMLSSIPTTITTLEGYQQALETIDAVNKYVTTANAAVAEFNNTTLVNFATTVEATEEGTDENAILTTGYLGALLVGESENDTYEDAIAAGVDYNGYVSYVDYLSTVKQYSSDADVASKVKEQVEFLTNNYANAATLEKLKAELAAPYNKAVLANIDTSKASEANPVDITSLIINPKYDFGTKGWSGEMTVDSCIVERWNTNFDIHQTIYNLPAGAYKVTVQSYYRDGGDASTAYNNFWYNLDEETGEWANPNAKLYANDQQSNVASLASQSFKERSFTQYVDKWVESEEGSATGEIVYIPHWTYQFKKEVTDAETGVVTYEDLDETTCSNDWPWDNKVEDLDEILFFPNSTTGARNRFEKSPEAYQNEVYAYLSEQGNLTFGIKKDVLIASDWTVMDNWKLYYIGTEVPTSITTTTTANATAQGIYSITGAKQNSLKRGINIVKMSDGRVVKRLVK